MKKLAFLLICFLMASGTSFSQLASSTATEDFQITATVLTALQITEINALQFGSVFQGTTKHLALDGTKTYTVAGETTTPASFDIDGAAGREVSITFSGHTSLVDASSNSMNIVYIAGDASAAAPASAGYNLSSTWNPETAAQTVTLDGTTGDAAVFLGGELQPGASQAAGNYSATATMTVVYTGN